MFVRGIKHTKKRPAGLNFGTYRCRVGLRELDSGAGFFELALGFFGVSLGDVFLNGLGGAVNQSLGLGQAETCKLANGLDDVNLGGTGARQNDRKGGLLFGGRGVVTTSGGAGSNSHRSSGGNAIVLLEDLDELRQLENAQFVDLLNQ